MPETLLTSETVLTGELRDRDIFVPETFVPLRARMAMAATMTTTAPTPPITRGRFDLGGRS